MIRRSQLFVPANEGSKIRKSVGLNADSIILDLEDSVPASEKGKARLTLEKHLQELDWGSRELCVRINKIDSRYSTEDLSFVERQPKVSTIVLPKTEEIPRAVGKTGKSVIPLIETARGLLNVEKILQNPIVTAVSIGPADLANSLGGAVKAYTQNFYVKTKVLVAAKANDVDAIDCVYFELQNLDGFRSEAIQSRDLGYSGKQVVHPSQIGIANEVYSPRPSEIEEARKIVEAYESAVKDKIGAFRLDDSLVDAVHYRKAKEVLEKASQISSG